MSRKSMTVAEIGQALGLEWTGQGERRLLAALPLDEAGPESLTFCEKASHLSRLPARAGAVIAPEAAEGWTVLLSPTPRVSFARALALMYPAPPPTPGVHPLASVATTAQIHPTASIGPYCLVGDGVEVGSDTVLSAFVAVGPGSSIGSHCRVEAHASLGADCRLGDECVIEPHARLLLGARLGRRVYVGARCILRSHCQIGEGCKIDNLALVGERTRVGPHSLLISQCLLNHDVELGGYCVIAAQAVIDSGVTLADQVQVAGRSWVRESVATRGMALAGEPALEYAAEMRLRALRSRLARA